MEVAPVREAPVRLGDVARGGWGDNLPDCLHHPYTPGQAPPLSSRHCTWEQTTIRANRRQTAWALMDGTNAGIQGMVHELWVDVAWINAPLAVAY